MNKKPLSRSAAKALALIALLLIAFALVPPFSTHTALASDDAEPAATSSASNEASGITALEEGEPDPEAKLGFLFAAFAITWAGFFAYAFFMSRKQQELRKEIDLLKKALEEKERGRGSSG